MGSKKDKTRQDIFSDNSEINCYQGSQIDITVFLPLAPVRVQGVPNGQVHHTNCARRKKLKQNIYRLNTNNYSKAS